MKGRKPPTLTRKDGKRPSFSLGSLYVTSNALDAFERETIDAVLSRHAAGDWGDIANADRGLNELALTEGNEGRLFSVYHFEDGSRLWVITEWDRSYTTVMLPEDY